MEIFCGNEIKILFLHHVEEEDQVSAVWLNFWMRVWARLRIKPVNFRMIIFTDNLKNKKKKIFMLFFYAKPAFLKYL